MYASHGSRREMEACLVDGDRVSPRLPRSSINAMLEIPRARGRGVLNSRGRWEQGSRMGVRKSTGQIHQNGTGGSVISFVHDPEGADSDARASL